MNTLYVIARGSDPEAHMTRAAALDASVGVGDPTGKITVYPSVAVTSSSLAPQITPDDTGQATLAEVQAAQQSALAAETAVANAVTTAASTVSTLLNQKDALSAQIASDLATVQALQPGATLDAATIAVLARVVGGFTTTMEAILAHLVLTGNAVV